MDLFPQQSSFAIHPTHEQDPLYYGENKNTKQETRRARVTMIYDGKVFVFSDVSCEKAEQILRLAEHEEENSTEIYTQLNHQRQDPTLTCNNSKQRILPSFVENTDKGNKFDVSTYDMTCALPIARRNSLNRFLEKRLDRCGGRGPYHNSGSSFLAISQPPAENKWWPGLAPSRHTQRSQ